MKLPVALPALGVLVVAVFAAALAAGDATTVYRRVDEQGVVSFSDVPPADSESAEAMTIRVPGSREDPAAQQRLDAMRETTDRMAADRREREKHRAQMRELAARNSPPLQSYQEPGASMGGDWYYPYSGAWNYPRRLPNQHRPPHHRPPLAPGIDTEAWSRTHNSQLMRPILPRGE